MEELYKYIIETYHVTEYDDTTPVQRELSDDPFEDNGRYYDMEGLEYVIKGNYTTKEKFEENLKNKLAVVEIKRKSVYVTKTEDKVSFKIFSYSRRRRLNGRGFKSDNSVRFVTFNVKTNSLYSGHMTNYTSKKKVNKKIRRNNFWESPLNLIKHLMNTMFYGSLSNKKLKEKMTEKHEVIGISINIFLSNIPGVVINPSYSDDENLYKRYLEYSGIKYSNNWKVFMEIFPQVTKKDLVKHKLKFIDAFMTKNGVSGEKLKRVLHTVNECNMESLKYVYNLLGEKFVNSQSDGFMKQVIETSVFKYYYMPEFAFKNDKEKRNVVEVMKLVMMKHITSNTFNDHINMITQIRLFEDFTWKSKTYDEFNNEHYDLTNKVSHYTQGDFTRKYDEKFVNTIEKPIELDYIYYPVVLKTSIDYNSESVTQSNCVKTYIKREESIIISLRRDEITGERVTIEYIVGHNGEKVFDIVRIQTLGRFNQGIDEVWYNVVTKLDDRINDYLLHNEFTLPVMNVVVGGREFDTECEVTDNIKMKHYMDQSDRTDFGYQLKWDKDLSRLKDNVNTDDQEETHDWIDFF